MIFYFCDYFTNCLLLKSISKLAICTRLNIQPCLSRVILHDALEMQHKSFRRRFRVVLFLLNTPPYIINTSFVSISHFVRKIIPNSTKNFFRVIEYRSFLPLDLPIKVWIFNVLYSK